MNSGAFFFVANGVCGSTMDPPVKPEDDGGKCTLPVAQAASARGASVSDPGSSSEPPGGER
jgi:hypothetical protein